MKCLLSFSLALFLGVVSTAQPLRTSWPMIGGDPMHTSYAQMNLTFPLTIAHTFDVGYRQESGMAVAEGRFFISDFADSNRLVVADLFTGDSLWSFGLPGTDGSMSFIPAVSEGVVVVGGQHGMGLYGLDVLTGDSLWLLPVQGLYTRCPVISDSMIYLPAYTMLSCINVHTGSEYWSFNDYIPQTAPAVDEQSVYFCSYDSLYALNKFTGDTAWVNGSIQVGHFMSLAVDDQYLFTGYDSVITALNKNTGEISWELELANDERVMYFPGTFAMTDDYLLTKVIVDGALENHYIVFDKATGAEVRRYPGGGFTYNAPTIVNNDVVDFGSQRLQFFNLLTGSLEYELTQVPMGGNYSQLIAADGKIYLSGYGPNILVVESAPSAVRTETSELVVDIFPNPVHDQIDLYFSVEGSSDVILRFLTTAGALIEQHDLGDDMPGGHRLSISVDHFVPGIYFVHLQSVEGQAIRRIIVE